MDILTKKNFMIISDLIIWSMAYPHEVYKNLLLLNLNILSGKYHGAKHVEERVKFMNIFFGYERNNNSSVNKSNNIAFDMYLIA